MSSFRDGNPCRGIAIGSFVTLLVVVLVWNGAAVIIDVSDLRDGGAWVPIWAVTIFCTIAYGGPAFLLSLAAMMIATHAGHQVALLSAWLIAAVSVAGAAVLVGVWGDVSGRPADAAFAVASLSLAVVLLGPGILCVRQALSERGRLRIPESATRHRDPATRRCDGPLS